MSGGSLMKLQDQKEWLVDRVARFTEYSAKHLPDDVRERLRALRASETTEFARIIYDAMFDNIEKADELSRPVCQDTGIIQFFARVGTRFPLIDRLEEILRDAVLLATRRAPLRHNAVEVFDEKNTGNNVGFRIPWIETELIPESDILELCVYMAGGGCSLPGIAEVLMPLEGYEGVVRFVFDRITTYGINACPPLLVGIGIAGSVEVAAKLSKKALLRPLGSRNENPTGADLERRIEEGLNKVGIGPGGLTGNMSVMGVHIEQAARHPATLAVGLSTGCWAHRRAWIRFRGDLSYEMLSHKGAEL